MDQKLWDRVEKMVGNPDYAVVFSVWPWPDGGWMAGVALHDREWAEEQGLSPEILRLIEERKPAWDLYGGFLAGLNARGVSAEQAIEELLAIVEAALPSWILREDMEPYLREKWGDEWEQHPSWSLSKPGEMVPRAAMELLGIRPEPLSARDMEKALEVARRFEAGDYHWEDDHE
jgi:hypothetical protein